MLNLSLILQCGSDHLLAESRQWVLESAGYSVKSAFDADGVRAVMENEPVSLLLICRTFQPTALNETLRAALSLQPTIQVLLMRNDSEFEMRVETMDDGEIPAPAELLRRVRRMVGPAAVGGKA
jgi:DNA-binding NtrC family response regulator